MSINYQSMSINYQYNAKLSLSQPKKSTTLNSQRVVRYSQNYKQNFGKENIKNSQINSLQKICIEEIIKQLKRRGSIQQEKLNQIIHQSQNILQNQPNVLRIVSPLYIIGDIHGQFYDLLYILQQNKISQKKYLFLGDYVDRGLFCIEVLTLLLALKIKYPKNIYLLRGNHQGRVMTTNFNFKTQCKYGLIEGQNKYRSDIYQKFIDLFSKLPLCAIVDNTYFCVHGGISPDAAKIIQLQKLNRFVQIQNKGVICDLLWSDPSEQSVMTWENNQMRGCSYFYSKIQAKQFLKENKVKLIIRGHQVQLQGFKYQKSTTQQKLTLTIFSAPNYCDTYRNKGAIAVIQRNQIHLKKFSESAHPFIMPNYLNCFQFTIPSLCQLVGKIFVYLLKNKRNGKRNSVIDDQTLQQINALQRVEIMNKIISRKIQEHEQVLLQKIINQKSSSQIDLNKSYQIAFQAFINKKFSDNQQKYPTDSRIKKLTNQIIKRQVFGPKITMKNNIMKKNLHQSQQQNDLIELIE